MVEAKIRESVIGYFEIEKEQIERELSEKLRKQREIQKKLKRIPFVIFWKHPLLWIYKWLLAVKSNGLRKEITKLQRRYNRFLKAIQSVKQGDLKPALEVIDLLLQKIPPTIPIGGTANITTDYESNPFFDELMALREKIVEVIALEEEK